MKPFPVSKFLGYVRGFERLHASAEGPGPLTESEREGEIQALAEMADEADVYSLFLTADQFRRIRQAYVDRASFQQIKAMFADLLNRLEDECRRHLMVMVDPAHVDYIGNPQFFDSTDVSGSKVSMQFPSAAEDIAEAGLCIAFGRATACVMHLNRVMECGLAALAGALDVDPQNDWGKYLSEIEHELQNRLKASKARTPEEQFYAEAQITFDGVRRAWRNPTMHVDRTYSPERAEEILLSVRSFMRHLATKLHDRPAL